ncbi:PepSY domain-containing protein [Chromatium okenii]|uniref:PepSY domain-containing protein n=1 Tax=Chromatium okenii TaxID=61644 RepID=UPI0026EF42C4|nr:PepSY domain-containing protein [Chromatium okenii]
MFITRRLLIFLIAAMFSASGSADHRARPAGDSAHDHARHALERGEVRPIAEILARVAEVVPGEVIGIEFERQHRHERPVWIYEIKVLAADGRRCEVEVDAATGHILNVEDD